MTNDQDVRTLARIAVIDDIAPAVNADRLELVTVGGWQVVVGKGTYTPGDKVIYLEIDSLIDVDNPLFDGELPDWLVSQAKDRGDGLGRRYRLKTARLRGNLSQGMILDTIVITRATEAVDVDELPVGTDVTGILDIVKYEPDVPATGDIVGEYPSEFAVKSDSERIQNLTGIYDEILDHDWIATEKIDGTSITLIVDLDTDTGEKIARVAGRNWELSADDHVIWTVIDRDAFLAGVPVGHAVQGELFGQNIQANPLGIPGKGFAVFNEYVDRIAQPRSNWSQWSLDLAVPTLDIELPATPTELIEMIDGLKSAITPGRNAEGVVFHEADGQIIDGLSRPNFKVISNRYLIKHHG